MDDLASHIAYRRAQLAELRTMDQDDARAACERIAAELRQLGADDGPVVVAPQRSRAKARSKAKGSRR